MVKNYFKLIVALVFATNVMAQNVPSYVPKNGLVGWWPFNGNANDESGNGNHGTVNGTTLTSDRNGKANSAYNFNGNGNFISVPHSKTLISNDITFNVWFEVSQNYNYGNLRILSKMKHSNATYFSYGFGLDSLNNKKNIGFSKVGCNTVAGQGGDETFKNIKTDKGIWYMYTGTITSIGEVTIYLNGNIIHKYKGSPFIQCDNILSELRFGHWWNGDNQWFFGNLDDISIYNRSLTDQEVKQLYEGCTKETATSSSFNSVVYTTNTPVNLSANPTGGTFNGVAVANNAFNPSKAKLGKNQVKYNFKNSTGCADSTNFTMILVDTLGNKCSTYDTLKIKVQLTTGIKAGQQTSMNVYPNPASEILIIEANDIQALSGYKYKILDIQGKEVYNALATSAKTEISLKSIGAKGMYILHIVDEKGVSIENKKIVLE